MLEKKSDADSVRTKRLPAFALLFNAFSWYLFSRSIMNSIGQTGDQGLGTLCLELAYPLSIIVAGVAGTFLLSKKSKTKLLDVWIVTGILASLTLALPMDNFVTILAVSIALGSSLGFGMPNALSYCAELTPIEKRGKTGGLVFFASLASAVLFVVLLPALNTLLSVSVLALWRTWSLPFSHFASKNKPMDNIDERYYGHSAFFRSRAFLLYFVAWLMFCLVDGFGGNVVSLHGAAYSASFRFLEPLIASISAVIGGVASDWVGRKRVITFGFVSLGFSYAVLGLAPDAGLSWLFFYVVDGIALGILWVLFTVVLWGEIATRSTAKTYAIGEIPYFLTGMMSLILAPYTVLIPRASAFSLAAFFLFIAVVPMIYAPETIPEKKMRERELKGYLDKAKRIKEEYT